MSTIYEVFGTNINTPHEKKYGDVVNAIGLNKLILSLPRGLTRDIIKRELENGNEALNGRITVDNNQCNDITLPIWDYAAGFTRRHGKVEPIPSQLRYLLKEIGITCYSNAEGVCLLKCAAKMYAMEVSV